MPGRCPVCQARFRGDTICSRCGADLRQLMLLTIEAWRSREASREALIREDYATAHRLALHAQQMCFTPAGDKLRILTSWLLSEVSIPAFIISQIGLTG